MIEFLHLSPYTPDGQFKSKIKQVSHQDISPVRVIAPPNMVCTTGSCEPYHLQPSTRVSEIPYVKLIEGSVVYDKVVAVSGFYLCIFIHSDL